MDARALEGRVAVVTGASAGIGEAAARRLSAAGARVVINARRQDRLEALARDLDPSRQGRVAIVAGDAADDAVISAMLEAAERTLGAPADAVIVNAGRGLAGSVFDSDTAHWEEMVRTNLLGAARLMREAARRMTGGSTTGAPSDWPRRARDIVVLGSNVGRHISPFSSMYGSTKFAVHSLAEALRRTLAPAGVRVTLIEPGIVRSEFQGVAGYDPQTFGAFMERVGPVLEPGDIADAIAHVLSLPPHVHLCDLVIRPTRQDYP